MQRLVENGLAQCVLGNHDLNLLLGDEKYDNNWFYGREFLFEETVVPQRKLHDDEARRKIKAFFASLPLALERPGLRVVHACWNKESVELARQASDVLELYRHHVRLIEESNAGRDLDQIDRDLELQNRNPVKMLTSGPERRIADPFESSGKIRHEERVPWWEEYSDPNFSVYGHYGAPPGQPHGQGRAVCIDYAVAKRWRERLYRDFRGKFKGKMASIRFPEKVIVFDDGTSLEFQG